MSNVLWLLVWLGFASAAVVFTLVFVALADRSIAGGRGQRSRAGEARSNDDTRPQSELGDSDAPGDEAERERDA